MATATITGKTGAGVTMTAQAFSDVRSFTVNNNTKMLELVDASGAVTQVSIAAATSFTVAVVESGYSITIS